MSVVQTSVEPAPFRGSGPFLAKAPPLWLPMRHFVFAALAFWAFAAGLAWAPERLIGFDFQAYWALGLTHTLTLGWAAMTILGAMTQLAPVLWETSLAAPGAAKAAWWLFSAGIAGFVGTLWSGSTMYWVPACALVIAVLLYLFVFLKTMKDAPRLDWTGKHLAIALGWLATLVTLGFLLALDRQRGLFVRDPDRALIAHVHAALVGWVSLTIVGVSYRLVSMFALSHLDSKTPGRLALALANAGLAGLVVDSLFLKTHRTWLWASLLALAYLAYAAQMRKLFSSRMKRIDPALGFTLAALAGGLAWAVFGVLLAFGAVYDTSEARVAYVLCALLGWVTPFILGQIHKIVPFLVWLHAYSPRQWKPPVKVPKIQDLTSEPAAWGELACLAACVPLLVRGVLTDSPSLARAGGLLLLACATLYLYNTALSLSHLFRRDPQWTIPETPSTPR